MVRPYSQEETIVVKSVFVREESSPRREHEEEKEDAEQFQEQEEKDRNHIQVRKHMIPVPKGAERHTTRFQI